MAIYNYTDTAATKINLNMTVQQAKALARFISTHGGGETSYSTVRLIVTSLPSKGWSLILRMKYRSK